MGKSKQSKVKRKEVKTQDCHFNTFETPGNIREELLVKKNHHVDSNSKAIAGRITLSLDDENTVLDFIYKWRSTNIKTENVNSLQKSHSCINESLNNEMHSIGENGHESEHDETTDEGFDDTKNIRIDMSQCTSLQSTPRSLLRSHAQEDMRRHLLRELIRDDRRVSLEQEREREEKRRRRRLRRIADDEHQKIENITAPSLLSLSLPSSISSSSLSLSPSPSISSSSPSPSPSLSFSSTSACLTQIEEREREKLSLPITPFRSLLMKTIHREREREKNEGEREREKGRVTLISGATGSGKTTQLPQYLLDYEREREKERERDTDRDHKTLYYSVIVYDICVQNETHTREGEG